MFAEEEAALLLAEAISASALESMLARRVSGEPLEQVVGWAEFRGLRIHVEPRVFVPRRRTELLVEEAIRIVRHEKHHPAPADGAVRDVLPPFRVVDMCCGSGAMATAIAEEIDGVEVYAVDVDPAATRCARRNLGQHGQVFTGDLFEPLPAGLGGRVDILVANAPYVPSDAVSLMPPEARDHEPRAALDGGPDGLDVQRRIIADAPAWLSPRGHLVVETGLAQVPGTLDACTGAGLQGRVVRDDHLDATAVVATSGRRSVRPTRGAGA